MKVNIVRFHPLAKDIVVSTCMVPVEHAREECRRAG